MPHAGCRLSTVQLLVIFSSHTLLPASYSHALLEQQTRILEYAEDHTPGEGDVTSGCKSAYLQNESWRFGLSSGWMGLVEREPGVNSSCRRKDRIDNIGGVWSPWWAKSIVGHGEFFCPTDGRCVSFVVQVRSG